MDANSILTAILTSVSIAIVLLIVFIEGIKIILVLKNKYKNPDANSAAGPVISPSVASLNEIENVLKGVLAETNPQSSALKIVSNMVSDIDGREKQAASSSSTGGQEANKQ